MYYIIKDFQTLVGAIFALATLMIGAHVKFRYDRRIARILRNERQAALHGSLYIETLLLCHVIGQLGEALLEHARSGTAVTDDFLAMYKLPEATVYNGIVKDLGEMDVYIAADFVSFYAHYSTLVRDTSLLVRNLPDRDSVHVLEIVDQAIKIARAALARVDATLAREDPKLPSTESISDFLASRPSAGTAQCTVTATKVDAGSSPA